MSLEYFNCVMLLIWIKMASFLSKIKHIGPFRLAELLPSEKDMQHIDGSWFLIVVMVPIFSG